MPKGENVDILIQSYLSEVPKAREIWAGPRIHEHLEGQAFAGQRRAKASIAERGSQF